MSISTKNFYEHKKQIILFIEHYLGIKIENPPLHPSEGYTTVAYENIPFHVIEPKGVFDLKFYKVICLNWVLHIEECEVETFLAQMDEFDFKTLKRLAKKIKEASSRNYRFFPEVSIETLQTDGSEYDDMPSGSIFNIADRKIEKLTNLIYKELETISRHLTHGAQQFNTDKDKAKLDDVYLRITTKDNGVNTKFYFSILKRPAIAHPGIDYPKVPSLMTDEDKQFYFDYPVKSKNDKEETPGRIKDKIDAALVRINNAIHSFLTNYLNDNEEVKQYLHKIVNQQLIPSLCSVNLEPYSFFAGLNENIFEGTVTGKNSESCIYLIDGEITRLFNHLDSIPVPEGSSIEHYAIDYDSFGIYGRDEKHVVVEAMVDPEYMFETCFASLYSDSFFEMFKRYLKTVKNKYVFSQLIINKNSETETE